MSGGDDGTFNLAQPAFKNPGVNPDGGVLFDNPSARESEADEANTADPNGPRFFSNLAPHAQSRKPSRKPVISLKL